MYYGPIKCTFSKALKAPFLLALSKRIELSNPTLIDNEVDSLLCIHSPRTGDLHQQVSLSSASYRQPCHLPPSTIPLLPESCPASLELRVDEHDDAEDNENEDNNEYKHDTGIAVWPAFFSLRQLSEVVVCITRDD